MIYMFLSNNPSSGDINSSNLSCFFLVIALCKFGQRKRDISKTVTARSFKLAQLIEDNEYTTW